MRRYHDGAVSAVAFSADGRLLATASDDKTARLFETASGKELARLAHDGRVNAVAFSADGRLLATASERVGLRMPPTFPRSPDMTARLFETAWSMPSP
jgi:WD40 repeat protein